MCGIVGYIGDKSADTVLLVGLERLEYRGYDSAGIAIIENNELIIKKKEGKLKVLNEYLREFPVNGNIGIGHTRWATHGEPTSVNAHPHTDCQKKIAVVHNGIIENYLQLKDKLVKKGHVFSTQTDTEVIPHLIEDKYDGSLETTILQVVKELEGSFALAIIHEDEPDKIIVVRCGSPLVIGSGVGENFIASDIPALFNLTKSVYYMEDKEIAIVKKDSVSFMDFNGKKINKELKHIKIE